MALNKYRPHLIVLPEDRANEEMANGFIQLSSVKPRAVHNALLKHNEAELERMTVSVKPFLFN